MKTLVAGIGNIFNRDDGFGSEVARRLTTRELPPDVVVEDFGIRGIHLAYALLDGFDLLVLIDAASRGEVPGTISVIEPLVDADAPEVDAHGIDAEGVLRMAARLGGSPARVLLVACEPESVDEGIGLSPAVDAVVDEAARIVEALL